MLVLVYRLSSYQWDDPFEDSRAVDSFLFIGYNREITWWSIITTKGRLLQDVCVSYVDDEVLITGLVLDDDEEMAVLIDRLNNQARLYAPMSICQRLAAQHYYELLIRRRLEETLTERIKRFLSLAEP